MTYKFAPTMRVFLLLCLCILIFGIPTYLFSTSTVDKTSGLTGQIIYGIVLLFFASSLVMSVYSLLTIKSICINNSGLTISYPFLFCSLKIDLNDILDKIISPQVIKYSARGGTFKIFEGKRIVIKYGDNKMVELNSFSIKNFNELCKRLFSSNTNTIDKSR